MIRQRYSGNRRLGVWLGLLALAVQALLPLLVAAEIRALTQDPLLFGALNPAITCLHDGAGQASDGPASHHHDMAACPLCTALAAAQAITPATTPLLPVPRQTATVPAVVAAAALTLFRYYGSYEARGPPART